MNKKQEFLKHVEPLSREDIQWVKELASQNKFDYYYDLIQSKAHNSPRFECEEAAIKLNAFLGELYTKWYDQFAAQNFDFSEKKKLKPSQGFGLFEKISQKFSSSAKKKFKAFLEDKRYNPHAQEHAAFLEKHKYSKYQEIMHQIKDNYPAVFIANISNFPYIDQDLSFVHFILNEKDIRQHKTECRLYLNAKTKNILPIAKELLQRSKNQKLPFSFKVSLMDDRNESMVFYSDYEHVADLVQMLDEIKEHIPYCFEGAGQIPAYMGKVHGYLGFGEEPIASNTSYTKERAHALKLLGKDNGDFDIFDVPNLNTDAKYMMLNQSTIKELQQDGFDLANIGSESSGAQRY